MKVFFIRFFSLIVLPFISVSTQLYSKTTPGYSCLVDLGHDTTVCNNAVFTLNPNPTASSGYVWTGSIGLSCYNCPSPEVSGLTTGVYFYIVTLTTPDCTDRDTIRITVIDGQAPQYQIAESRYICAGDSVLLGGPAFPGFAYNWRSEPPGFVSTKANPAAKPNVPTTYYVLVSDTSTIDGLCPSILVDSVRITPVSLTLQVTPTDTVRLCQGSSRTFTASTVPSGIPVEWLPPDGLQIGPNGNSVVATPTRSTPYTATVTLDGCTRTRNIYVVVDSLPADLEIYPKDTTICLGDTAFLYSAPFPVADYPGITFSWIPALSAGTPTNQNTFVAPQALTLYRRVTQSKNRLCKDTSFALVRTVPPPTMEMTPELSVICPGDSVLLKITYSDGVGNIVWAPASGLSCAANCDSVWAKPAASRTYIATGNNQGCPASDSARIEVLPRAPLQFPADLQLCFGDTVTLNELFDPLATYVWTSTHPGFDTITEKTPRFVPTQTAVYRVKTISADGCVSYDSVVVKVIEKPNLTAKGDTTICKNFTTRLSVQVSQPGLSIEWWNVDANALVGTGQTLDVTPEQTTTYAVIYTYGDGDQCKLTDTVTVKIDGEAPVLVLPADLSICPGDSVVLNSGTTVSGTTFSWAASPPDPTLDPGASNPRVFPRQNTTYSVTASLGKCSVSRQIPISAPSATLSVSADNTTLCAGSALSLTATGSAQDGTYKWSDGTVGPELNAVPDQDTSFTLIYMYGDSCVLYDTVLVDVVPGFSVSIDMFPDTDTVDVGEEMTLTAIVTPPQNLANFDFHWQEITIDTKDLPFTSESIEVVPSSNDTATKEVRYRLTATAPNGCVQIVEKRIYLIFPLVRFPNAFTPNGDNVNDTFGMVLLEGLAYVSSMQIYNRWGQLVFSSTDQKAAWDGTIEGTEAPMDVYFYRVWWRRGDNALQVLAQGDINLLR